MQFVGIFHFEKQILSINCTFLSRQIASKLVAPYFALFSTLKLITLPDNYRKHPFFGMGQIL